MLAPLASRLRTFARPAHRRSLINAFTSQNTHSFQRVYYPALSDVEELEEYAPGGFCPIMLGSKLSSGRYEVVHKLGHGGSSTVWLARDGIDNRLVAVKVLAARRGEGMDTVHELSTYQRLARCGAEEHGSTGNIRLPISTFTASSVNGKHACLVHRWTGPSLDRMFWCPGETEGSSRIRAKLVPKLAKQAVEVVELAHSTGVILQDLAPSNWTFDVNNDLAQMLVDELYARVGRPETELVRRTDRQPTSPHAPEKVIEPMDMTGAAMAAFVKDSLVFIDPGDAVLMTSPNEAKWTVPRSYEPPEARWGGHVSQEGDVWQLGLLFFEMLTGYPFSHSWSSPCSGPAGRYGGTLMDGKRVSGEVEEGGGDEGQIGDVLEQCLREVGTSDEATNRWRHPLHAPFGQMLMEEQVQAWTSILVGILRGSPEQRPEPGVVKAWLAERFP